MTSEDKLQHFKTLKGKVSACRSSSVRGINSLLEIFDAEHSREYFNEDSPLVGYKNNLRQSREKQMASLREVIDMPRKRISKFNEAVNHFLQDIDEATRELKLKEPEN